ncbi:putative nucleotidyltransferase substrate binding domain-containing protein [Variovorax sp. RA8]|uniref:putative nucleotidyltransferase substrate binding domain-containing protein n=1 Tax=Variovorax sp. (strain JCM 16519 / RA8) TaxID=662548 RepID=UPI00131657DE|nr:putative nucleotidyltransferase substrate binding domain-containing protein [Variovorax sp. RA8]VTU21893.1 putative signal-transduction protein containing cAMP-binding and CBS domains [Variovorax sp. RA8]
MRSGEPGSVPEMQLLGAAGLACDDPRAVARQMDDAATVAELAVAAARVDAIVALLHDGGLKIDRIAKVTAELNACLFRRMWSLLAPAELVANSCLVVMGSEGRGEQLLKTDQDNALLLRDGFQYPGLETVTAQFSAGLAELGYPPCPGRIMLSNPLWCQPLAGFREVLREWVYGVQPEGPMHLAIFIDSLAVAGDASLLAQARDHLDRILDRTDVFFARFASAIELFDPHPNWWHRLVARDQDEALDLKKLGTFPIVHGVRALALQQRLRDTGTAQRLRLLVEQQQIEPGLARDVLDALHWLMALKLTGQLRRKQGGQVPDNCVRPSELGTLERDTLRSALGIVRRFRGEIQQRFRLDAL